MANTKLGRPRRYDLRPVTGFANAEVALAVAALDELLERALDQFDDLPQEALAFAPQGTPLTIGALVIHMAWAEMGWVERIAPASVPDDLRARLEPGRKVPKGEMVTSAETARDLVALCHRVRDEVSYPALATHHGCGRCNRRSTAPADAARRADASHLALDVPLGPRRSAARIVGQRLHLDVWQPGRVGCAGNTSLTDSQTQF